MSESIENIKKLSPEDRIVKLRELEEERKKEIIEAEKIINESVEQIKKEEQLKEELSVSEIKEVDLKKKFEEENLEEKILEEKIKVSEEEITQHQQYQINLSKEPTEDLYGKLKEFYQQVKEAGYMTQEQQQEISNLGTAINYKSQDMKTGNYKSTNEQITEMMGASNSILKYFKG